MMLLNVPKILSPELLWVISSMGHGDTITIGDANFPGDSFARKGNCRFIRADGLGGSELLEAILTMIPSDDFVDTPFKVMQTAPKDEGMPLPIIDEYTDLVGKFDARGKLAFESVERFAFYDLAAKSYCIVQSGEEAIYANIIVQKGVIK